MYLGADVPRFPPNNWSVFLSDGMQPDGREQADAGRAADHLFSTQQSLPLELSSSILNSSLCTSDLAHT